MNLIRSARVRLDWGPDVLTLGQGCIDVSVQWRGARSPRRALSLAVPVAILAAVLAGCGGSHRPTLDPRGIERTIAKSIRDEHNVAATVSCPSGIPLGRGLTFTCVASLQVGRYPLHVREVDAKGSVRWLSTAPLRTLDISRVQSAIERSIRAQRGAEATVACPSEVLQQSGLKFTCVATVTAPTPRVKAGRYPFRVTEVNAAGKVTYLAP